MANSTINQLEYHGTLYDVEDTAARTGLETKADTDDVNAALSGKVDKVSGKGLSTNDYTTAEKTKLAGIAEGAEVNVQSDWNQTTTTADDYIKNKPTLGTAAAANTSDFATAAQGTKADNAIPSSEKGAANGVAELDSNGLVPSSQLPSYVDDVLEYSSQSAFPVTGQTGKIYIAQDTNKTYRWSGSAYVEISASLALGTTDSTAYRGDRGQTAYNHATDSSRLTTAKASGFYKIATTAEGHVASATDVTKTDITNLGIPAQDTTYESKSAASGGTAVSLVTTGEKYLWNNKQDTIPDLSTIRSGASAGATAVQPAALNDYATTTAMNTAISLVEDSVSSLANRGAKNAYRITNVPTVSGVTITQIDESSASLVGTFSGNTYVFFNLSGNNFILPKGDWIVSYIFDGTASYSRKLILSTNDGDLQIDPNTEVSFTTTADRSISAYFNYFTDETINATIRIMIRPAEITDNTYIPYAPTNAELYEMIQALQSGRSLQSTANMMSTGSLDKTELANVDDGLASIDDKDKLSLKE